MNTIITVQVLLALENAQPVQTLHLPAGATVAEALQHSPPGVEGLVPAIYGRLVQLSTVLSDSDRLELLRPLHADPKDQRRAKIKAARKLRRPMQAKPT